MLLKALCGDLHISPHFVLREEFHLDYMNSYERNQSSLLVSYFLSLVVISLESSDMCSIWEPIKDSKLIKGHLGGGFQEMKTELIDIKSEWENNGTTRIKLG